MNLIVQIEKKLGTFHLSADFSIENETFAILGASGSGKSMTLKCIAGIETPDSGRIVLNGKVLYDSEQGINMPCQKRQAGYLFQDYALFPNMTVMQNIMAGMRTGADHQRALRLIQQFQLTGLKTHYPSQLSGGQKQRTAIARMLASEPEVLLLDEPFSALDTHLRWEMEMELRSILKELKKPVILVSHNRNEVYRLSNSVSCMEDGIMEKPMPVKEFFHQPKTRMAAVMSGCKNLSRAEIVDRTHILAKDWNQILEVTEICEEINYVGIRAHSWKRYQGDNVFEIAESRVIEEPFEWNVSFRTEGSREWLQWKVSKEETREMQVLPCQLYVGKEDIMLLK